MHWLGGILSKTVLRKHVKDGGGGARSKLKQEEHLKKPDIEINLRYVESFMVSDLN